VTDVMLVAAEEEIFEHMCAQLRANPPQDAEVVPDDVRELSVVLRFAEIPDVARAVQRAGQIANALTAQLELPAKSRIKLGLRTTFGLPERN
jgi:hypothetical protein